MQNHLAHDSFLRSEQALAALEELRAGANLSSLNLGGLSPDDRTYLEAEDCIRNVVYSQVEARIQPGTSTWVKSLVYCYRDLFTHPARALDVLDELESQCPTHSDFPLRLQFWRMHLNLLMGEIEIGRRTLIQISAKIPDGIWKNEMLAIRAMGYYFIGRTRDALQAHYDCQKSIDLNPDIFLQTFDCGMAARTALKLCDPSSFEYFSERLDDSLRKKEDSRYRLRNTGYRAMIFNQLGEHETAETHWSFGDSQLHLTESALERGQYLVFRGMSYALVNDLANAHKLFELARHDLKLAGSPGLYLAELDIAERLAPIASPEGRSVNLKAATEATIQAQTHFSEMAMQKIYPLQEMYSESADFCESILIGTTTGILPDGRQSLVLSVIENVTNIQQFAKGLSHFRLIPDFIKKLSHSDLTNEGLIDSMQSVLRVRPVLVNDEFHLPGALHTLENQNEVKSILEFAATLYSMGIRLRELSSTQFRLKEAERAKHLLHDVRPFINELSNKAKNDPNSLYLSKLSNDLNTLIESYLKAMVDGENPAKPTIVSFPRLLEQVVETTHQSTGKRAEIPEGKAPPFLWISEELLKRLMVNLIKNGIEAGSGPRPVSISFKVDKLEGQEKLVIYVSDNGPGLDPKTFEELTNNPDLVTPTSKKNGIGMGLKSAIERAKEVGAELTIVPSTRSKGTTFKVSIPLPKAPMITTEPELLVIDDSSAIAEAWNRFGEKEKIAVRTVYSEHAVATLNQLSKGVSWIIIDYDLKLPNTTGADLAQDLFALGPKVALSTGFSETELPNEVVNLPWDAIIGKDPQYPTVNRKKHPSQNLPSPILQLQPNDAIAARLRHEIRNELTPLKAVYTGLQDQLSGNPYLTILADAIKVIETSTRKKPKENAAM